MTVEKKSRLGRGLDALLGGDDLPLASPANGPTRLAVGDIEVNPFQPRKSIDDDELQSLGESISHHGILQPLVVRQVGERFQLIAGERRLRAARKVGLDSVPVTVVDFNDQQTLEAALAENLQRSDLNPIDKALAFKDYLDRYSVTQDELATRLGMGRTSVTNLVSLLDLPEAVRDLVKAGTVTLGHAKVLKSVRDPARQVEIAKEIVARGMSIRETTALVEQGGDATPTPAAEGTAKESKPPVEKTAHVKGIEDELRQKLGLKIEIKVKAKEKGQILLSFDSNDDFERAVELLRR